MFKRTRSSVYTTTNSSKTGTPFNTPNRFLVLSSLPARVIMRAPPIRMATARKTTPETADGMAQTCCAVRTASCTSAERRKAMEPRVNMSPMRVLCGRGGRGC